MSIVAKLKKEAADLEAKKQFDKAVKTYARLFAEFEKHPLEVDAALFNRVGDLQVKLGQVAEAVDTYEKGVDYYAEGGFFNNAIALCNKILRQTPGRASIYYKLGKVSAQKGFKNEARQNFLEYADRMEKAGKTSEAFRALMEFMDLVPDQDDVRTMLAEQLIKADRKSDAVVQLQRLYERHIQEGRVTEADAVAEKVKALDPNAELSAGGDSSGGSSGGDLIFLDLNDPTPPRTSSQSVPAPKPPPPPAPKPAPPPPPPPPPPVAAAPPPPPPPPPAAPPEAVAPPPPPPSPPEPAPLPPPPPAAQPPVEEEMEITRASDQKVDVGDLSFDSNLGIEPTSLGGDAAPPAPADDLLIEPTSFGEMSIEPEAPTISSRPSTPATSLPTADMELEIVPDPEPDHSLLDIEELPAAKIAPIIKEDEERPSAFDLVDLEPIEAEAEEEAEEEEQEEEEVEEEEELKVPEVSAPPPPKVAAKPAPPPAAAAPAAGPAAEKHLNRFQQAAKNAPQSKAAAPSKPPETPKPPAAPVRPAAAAPAKPAPAAPPRPAPPKVAPPKPAAPAKPVPVATAEFDLREDVEPSRKSTVFAAKAVNILQAAVAGSPEDWSLRRELAEAMLEAGDRTGGLHELEVAMNGAENSDDLELAMALAEELGKLEPLVVKHHQKRVEYAFRRNDKPRLVEAYLTLGDALVQNEHTEKARAVYQRVLELAPDNLQAQAAMDMLMPAGRPTTPPPPTTRSSATHAGKRAIATPPPSAPRNSGPAAPVSEDGFVNLGDWLREDENPKDTRMVVDEQEPTGDEDADFADMLKKFKQGVAENVDAEDYQSHYDLAIAFKEMGLLDEAIAGFQKALGSKQNRLPTYEALGECFLEKGQAKMASAILTRAVTETETSDDQLVGVLYLLGRASEEQGEAAKALEYYQRVFVIDIQFRDVADRMASLEAAR
jgi:tetratricopeptide (TPR) repeat protein